MKTRLLVIISLILLTAGIAVAGSTMAWFGDEQVVPSSVGMTLGTVEVDVIDFHSNLTKENDAAYSWDLDEHSEVQFSWSIENAGSKRVFVRARLWEEYEYYPADGDSTWGAEPDLYEDDGQKQHKYVFPDARWQTYFAYEVGEEKTAVMVEGAQHDRRGEAQVQPNGEELEVTISLDDDWLMTEAYLDVASDVEGFPFRGNSSIPPPGQMEWKAEDMLVDEHTFTISKPGEDEVVIAVKATVVGESETAGSPVSEWDAASDCSGDWRQGEDDWWYYCPPGGVEPDSEITLGLQGLADEELDSGTYEVKLEVEGLQASDEAVADEWPGAPCSSD